MRQLLCLFFATLALQAQPPQPPAPGRGGPAGGRGAAQGPVVGPMARMAAQAPFNNNCASCHKNSKSSTDEGLLKENNAPSTDTLATMTPEAIYAALTTGAMLQQAAKLSDSDKRLIAEFFGGRTLGAADQGDAKNMTNHCAANPQMGNIDAGPTWSGWSADLANTRLQPAKAAGLTAAQVPKLQLKWAFGFPAGVETYGQPTIADGRLFIGDDNSYV